MATLPGPQRTRRSSVLHAVVGAGAAPSEPVSTSGARAGPLARIHVLLHFDKPPLEEAFTSYAARKAVPKLLASAAVLLLMFSLLMGLEYALLRGLSPEDNTHHTCDDGARVTDRRRLLVIRAAGVTVLYAYLLFLAWGYRRVRVGGTVPASLYPTTALVFSLMAGIQAGGAAYGHSACVAAAQAPLGWVTVLYDFAIVTAVLTSGLRWTFVTPFAVMHTALAALVFVFLERVRARVETGALLAFSAIALAVAAYRREYLARASFLALLQIMRDTHLRQTLLGKMLPPKIRQALQVGPRARLQQQRGPAASSTSIPPRPLHGDPLTSPRQSGGGRVPDVSRYFTRRSVGQDVGMGESRDSQGEVCVQPYVETPSGGQAGAQDAGELAETRRRTSVAGIASAATQAVEGLQRRASEFLHRRISEAEVFVLASPRTHVSSRDSGALSARLTGRELSDGETRLTAAAAAASRAVLRVGGLLRPQTIYLPPRGRRQSGRDGTSPDSGGGGVGPGRRRSAAGRSATSRQSADTSEAARVLSVSTGAAATSAPVASNVDARPGWLRESVPRIQAPAVLHRGLSVLQSITDFLPGSVVPSTSGRATWLRRSVTSDSRGRQYSRRGSRVSSVGSGGDSDEETEVFIPPAHYYNDVSVLFVYLDRFNEVSGECPPLALVSFLNRLYGSIDDLVEKLGCYKVMAIANMYLVVCGAPEDNACPDHVAKLSGCALEILKFSAERRELMHVPGTAAGLSVQLQAGIHCGELAAGVIGCRTINWHVYGDTVNTASRMCSTGQPGKVQLSPQASDALRAQPSFQSGAFVLSDRGEVYCKGKGMVHTCWLSSPELEEAQALQESRRVRATFRSHRSSDDEASSQAGASFAGSGQWRSYAQPASASSACGQPHAQSTSASRVFSEEVLHPVSMRGTLHVSEPEPLEADSQGGLTGSGEGGPGQGSDALASSALSLHSSGHRNVTTGVDTAVCLAAASGTDGASAQRVADSLTLSGVAADESAVHNTDAWYGSFIQSGSLVVGGNPDIDGAGGSFIIAEADARRERTLAASERLASFGHALRRIASFMPPFRGRTPVQGLRSRPRGLSSGDPSLPPSPVSPSASHALDDDAAPAALQAVLARVMNPGMIDAMTTARGALKAGDAGGSSNERRSSLLTLRLAIRAQRSARILPVSAQARDAGAAASRSQSDRASPDGPTAAGGAVSRTPGASGRARIASVAEASHSVAPTGLAGTSSSPTNPSVVKEVGPPPTEDGGDQDMGVSIEVSGMHGFSLTFDDAGLEERFTHSMADQSAFAGIATTGAGATASFVAVLLWLQSKKFAIGLEDSVMAVRVALLFMCVVTLVILLVIRQSLRPYRTRHVSTVALAQSLVRVHCSTALSEAQGKPFLLRWWLTAVIPVQQAVSLVCLLPGVQQAIATVMALLFCAGIQYLNAADCGYGRDPHFAAGTIDFTLTLVLLIPLFELPFKHCAAILAVILVTYPLSASFACVPQGFSVLVLRMVALFVATVASAILCRAREVAARYAFNVQEHAEQRQRRCASLLGNMLPSQRHVAQLLRGEHVVESLPKVAMLYSDIVGFTDLCTRLSPTELIHLLDDLYSGFDRCLVEVGLYKVETIGDAFIAVGGLNTSEAQGGPGTGAPANAEDQLKASVRACALLSQQMLAHVAALATKTGLPLGIRVGIHVDTAVGGVVGRSRPRYFIWGAGSVMANGMESTGVPGACQVSESAAVYLSEDTHGSIRLGAGTPPLVLHPHQVVTVVNGKPTPRPLHDTERRKAQARFDLAGISPDLVYRLAMAGPRGSVAHASVGRERQAPPHGVEGGEGGGGGDAAATTALTARRSKRGSQPRVSVTSSVPFGSVRPVSQFAGSLGTEDGGLVTYILQPVEQVAAPAPLVPSLPTAVESS